MADSELHYCASPTCPGRGYKASELAHPPNCGAPPGWTLDATGPQPILTSADGHERVVLRRDGSLSAFYRGVQGAVPHDAAVFLLGLYEARGARQS